MSVGHELGLNATDKHLAYSDDGFPVTMTSLDSVIALTKFRMLLGMDECIGICPQKKLKVRYCMGNECGLAFSAAMVIP